MGRRMKICHGSHMFFHFPCAADGITLIRELVRRLNLLAATREPNPRLARVPRGLSQGRQHECNAKESAFHRLASYEATVQAYGGRCNRRGWYRGTGAPSCSLFQFVLFKTMFRDR